MSVNNSSGRKANSRMGLILTVTIAVMAVLAFGYAFVVRRERQVLQELLVSPQSITSSSFAFAQSSGLLDGIHVDTLIAVAKASEGRILVGNLERGRRTVIVTSADFTDVENQRLTLSFYQHKDGRLYWRLAQKQ